MVCLCAMAELGLWNWIWGDKEEIDTLISNNKIPYNEQNDSQYVRNIKDFLDLKGEKVERIRLRKDLWKKENRIDSQMKGFGQSFRYIYGITLLQLYLKIKTSFWFIFFCQNFTLESLPL
jgi:hypothetical protein